MLYNFNVNGNITRMTTNDIKIRLREVEQADQNSYWVQNGLFNGTAPSSSAKCLWAMMCCLCSRNCCFSTDLETTRIVLEAIEGQIMRDRDLEITDLYSRAIQNFYKTFYPNSLAKNEPILVRRRNAVPNVLDVDGAEADRVYGIKETRVPTRGPLRILPAPSKTAEQSSAVTTNPAAASSRTNDQRSPLTASAAAAPSKNQELSSKNFITVATKSSTNTAF